MPIIAPFPPFPSLFLSPFLFLSFLVPTSHLPLCGRRVDIASGQGLHQAAAHGCHPLALPNRGATGLPRGVTMVTASQFSLFPVPCLCLPPAPVFHSRCYVCLQINFREAGAPVIVDPTASVVSAPRVRCPVGASVGGWVSHACRQ